jgi:YHS domain-containing protein
LALGTGIFSPFFAPFSPSFSVSWAATDNQLAVNATTGLAISGFDPVAYFTEGKALFGRPEFELNQEGSVWRFNNEGNRGAFEKNPEVYAPQFGGYDPVAIGRGRSVQGHPLIWAVAGQRLYLFYSEQTRASFLADPGRIIDTAERKWPDVRNMGQ